MVVDITALYCCLDYFCKLFADWEVHGLLPSGQTRRRPGKLSRAEMLFRHRQLKPGGTLILKF